MNEVARFFNSIEFNHPEYMDEAKVLKVLLLKKKEVFEVYLHIKKVLPTSICEELFACTKKGIFGSAACLLKLSYDEIKKEELEEYVTFFKMKLLEEKPSLMGLKETKFTLDEDIITFEVTSKFEEAEIKREAKYFRDNLKNYGFGNFEIASFLNKELNEEGKKEIEKCAPRPGRY